MRVITAQKRLKLLHESPEQKADNEAPAATPGEVALAAAGVTQPSEEAILPSPASASSAEPAAPAPADAAHMLAAPLGAPLVISTPEAIVQACERSHLEVAGALGRIQQLLTSADELIRQTCEADGKAEADAGGESGDSEGPGRDQRSLEGLVKAVRILLGEALACFGTAPTETGETGPLGLLQFPGDEDDEPRTRDALRHGSFRLYAPLGKLSTIEVLEFTRTTRKTGSITVEDTELRGFIDVFEGEAIYAEAGELMGFDAFREVLSSSQGRVEFHSIPVSPQRRNLDRPTLELLFRALQSLDESCCELRR